MDKVYLQNEYGYVNPYYRISGTAIDSGNVYYKGSNGTLYNHNTYKNDPGLDEYNPEFYDDPLKSYLENDVFSDETCILFNSNGDPLLGSDFGLYEYAYFLKNGELRQIDYNQSVAIKLISDGGYIVYNTNALYGNYIYEQYKNDSTKLPIYGEYSNVCKLVTRYTTMYRAAVLYGLDNMDYYSGNYTGAMLRGKVCERAGDRDLYYNGGYINSVVDTRATCFENMLSILRGGNFYYYYLSGNVETYGPYILNRVGKCVTITHAPDLNIYSKINFGDGTGIKCIFTDPESHDFEECLIESCWHGEAINNNDSTAEPTKRPTWGDSFATNKDPYLGRMRDYRAVHRYANNGTYTITIESYTIKDNQGSDTGTAISHTTHSFTITVGDAADQDIIYFKIPKEFDHIYLNGVRCPVVEQANDYNVVGLDVTGYNWLLGKVCAGRHDVVLCSLPLLSTTNYTKYQCRVRAKKTYWGKDPTDNKYKDIVINDVDSTFDMVYDAKSQLYYVDDLAGKLNIPAFGCSYFDNNGAEEYAQYYPCSLTVLGVAQDNSTTEVLNTTSYSPRECKIYTPQNTGGFAICDYYYGWEPFFARSSIQVAEFENDYVRNTTDVLTYVRDSRSTAKFMSDYTNMTTIPAVFGNDAILPLCSYFGPDYYSTYETSYDPAGGTPGNEAIAILTEACIGKTYDLRNAIPWKAFFPGCYCVDAPLNVYD